MDWDPYSDRWRDDPYPKYRELRDAAPLHHAPRSNAWTVSRYEDVVAVLRNTEVFSSKTRGGRMEAAVGELSSFEKLKLGARFLRRMRASPWALRRSRMLIQEDGGVHLRMRDLVNRGFTPRQIQRLVPRIHALVAECLAGLRSKPSFDLVSELNIPLPVTVIAELLGVEPSLRHDFKRWSDAIITGGTGSAMSRPLDSGVLDAMAELRAYLRPIVKERRRRPADDLISVLVAAEVEGEGLSDYEIFLFVLLLLVAGNETTTNLLGNAVDALLAHPEQLAKVVAEPALVPALVEETLRFDGPVQFVTRVTTREFALHGQTLPPRALVVVLLGSANRDERRFAEPDRFDVGRDARGHVAFGFGAHFCLGASLARLEAKAALEALVPELPRLVRAHPEREFLDSYLIRGRARLELTGTFVKKSNCFGDARPR
jgi:cytochrome P450